ncbi:hypothetical protein FB45DRAFT_278049 [Roridomyces roridus]|uniref:Uncharacterized protein n=1 Tax=Roridomyces roridus TaxID=1738132 RepID=A0AAD7FWM8_9AGAR|nr:hypothetical protein FB45DRAFT_278049 [Roridomyces roridus]
MGRLVARSIGAARGHPESSQSCRCCTGACRPELHSLDSAGSLFLLRVCHVSRLVEPQWLGLRGKRNLCTCLVSSATRSRCSGWIVGSGAVLGARFLTVAPPQHLPLLSRRLCRPYINADAPPSPFVHFSALFARASREDIRARVGTKLLCSSACSGRRSSVVDVHLLTVWPSCAVARPRRLSSHEPWYIYHVHIHLPRALVSMRRCSSSRTYLASRSFADILRTLSSRESHLSVMLPCYSSGL